MTQNTEIYCEFYPQNDTSSNACIFGCTQNKGTVFAFNCFDSGNFQYGTKRYTLLYNINSWNTFTLSNGRAVLNETAIDVEEQSVFPQNSLYLFARHIEEVESDYSLCAFRKFRILENGIIQRDFIPCRRNADKKVGFFDKANYEFYEIEQGNEDFGINSGVDKKSYLSYNSDGTPKKYKVVGEKTYFTGAVWQKLYLQEYY